GRRAAAANLADIAAMGAAPTGLLVALACPPALPLDWADGLADGLREECDLVGVGVVGGDVARSDVLTVAVSAGGRLEGRDPVDRGGAQPGAPGGGGRRAGRAGGGAGGAARGFPPPGGGGHRPPPARAAVPRRPAGRRPGRDRDDRRQRRPGGRP